MPLPIVRYASVAWDESVLLSALFHDEVRGRDHCTLWRFDPSDCSCKMLNDDVFEIPARHLDGGDSGSISRPTTSIRLIPGVKKAGDQIAEIVWETQDWVSRFQLSDEQVLTEVPLRSGPDWRFVSWQRLKDGLIILTEDADGRRRLLRTVPGSSESWEFVAAPSNSDQISGLAVFDGFVYVTIDDARRGFTLWALRIEEIPAEAGSWRAVLEFGAFRYLRNANALELVSCEDALYLAAGLKQPLSADQSIATFACQDFELLRVYPNGGGWDIVIGQPRFTIDGLKVPLSGRGAGFNERDPLRVGCLINTVSGLHLGVQDDQMVQLWKLAGTDQWEEVCHGAFLEYQRARLAAAYPTPCGILLIAECLDFGGLDSLELWILPQET